MAKATDKAVAEPTFVTPKALAEELDVDAKRIRAFLRGSEHARSLEAKNTSWLLDEATANAVRDRFTPSADDADDDSEGS
jgi:hypothetical protein